MTRSRTCGIMGVKGAQVIRVRIEDEVIERLIGYLEVARDAQFAVGDEILEQVRLHGTKAEVINYLAGQLQVSPSTLYDYCRISERWTPYWREVYQHLDWTIYRNADPEDTDDRKLLDRAVDEQWTSTKFKEEKFTYYNDLNSVFDKLTRILLRVRKNVDDDKKRRIDHAIGVVRLALLDDT